MHKLTVKDVIKHNEMYSITATVTVYRSFITNPTKRCGETCCNNVTYDVPSELYTYALE